MTLPSTSDHCCSLRHGRRTLRRIKHRFPLSDHLTRAASHADDILSQHLPLCSQPARGSNLVFPSHIQTSDRHLPRPTPRPHATATCPSRRPPLHHPRPTPSARPQMGWAMLPASGRACRTRGSGWRSGAWGAAGGKGDRRRARGTVGLCRSRGWVAGRSRAGSARRRGLAPGLCGGGTDGRGRVARAARRSWRDWMGERWERGPMGAGGGASAGWRSLLQVELPERQSRGV
jgi:hypothetical protein